MANHKSAVKRARQSLVRNARNTSTTRAVRSVEKKLHQAIATNQKEEVQKLLAAFSSKIGKAAQKGIFHAKTASRKISRLSAAVHKLTAK